MLTNLDDEVGTLSRKRKMDNQQTDEEVEVKAIRERLKTPAKQIKVTHTPTTIMDSTNMDRSRDCSMSFVHPTSFTFSDIFSRNGIFSLPMFCTQAMLQIYMKKADQQIQEWNKLEQAIYDDTLPYLPYDATKSRVPSFKRLIPDNGMFSPNCTFCIPLEFQDPTTLMCTCQGEYCKCRKALIKVFNEAGEETTVNIVRQMKFVDQKLKIKSLEIAINGVKQRTTRDGQSCFSLVVQPLSITLKS